MRSLDNYPGLFGRQRQLVNAMARVADSHIRSALMSNGEAYIEYVDERASYFAESTFESFPEDRPTAAMRDQATQAYRRLVHTFRNPHDIYDTFEDDDVARLFGVILEVAHNTESHEPTLPVIIDYLDVLSSWAVNTYRHMNKSGELDTLSYRNRFEVTLGRIALLLEPETPAAQHDIPAEDVARSKLDWFSRHPHHN